MIINIPNLLTLARISLIPVFVVFFYCPFGWSRVVAATIFAVACFTDWLDGYFARKLKQMSALGQFLDPVADKLLVAVALILLVGVYATPLLAIPAAIIVSREILISALREWMAELGKRAHVAVSWVGKVKTAAQMSAIFILLLLEPNLSDKKVLIGYALLYLACALTLISMFIYLKVASNLIMKELQTKPTNDIEKI